MRELEPLQATQAELPLLTGLVNREQQVLLVLQALLVILVPELLPAVQVVLHRQHGLVKTAPLDLMDQPATQEQLVLEQLLVMLVELRQLAGRVRLE